jgi:hypothetical protein
MEEPRPGIVGSKPQESVSLTRHLDCVTTYRICLAFLPLRRIHGRVIGCDIEGFVNYLESVAVKVAGLGE